MLKTDNQNKTPVEREFEQTETYKTIHRVSDKVVREIDRASEKVARELSQAGLSGDTVAKGISEAAREIGRAVNTVSRNLSGQNPQNRPPYPPQQPNPGMPQDRGGYTYAPRSPYPQPPRQPYRPVQSVPPPVRPNMVMKRKPSNARFWFAGVLCTLYALNMPMYRWVDLAALAAVGVGAFFLGKAIFKGKKVFVPVEEKKPEPVKAEPEPIRKSATGDPEVDRIIDEGHEYLKQLRQVNDRIPDEVMSRRISRMEAASADIFAYIAEHPDKAAQIRRFMNYYLPTTLKLLTSYDKLSRQRVKGENIQKTMFEIEGMMETIAGAFEKQLDSLFDDDAMDIAADISVMESILKQEGLSDDENRMPKVKPAESGGSAAQQEQAAGMPALTLDPNEADQTHTR